MTAVDHERLLVGLTAQIGWAIRDERLRRSWTIRELATRAGVSSSLLQ
jgi:hypothetical protein